MYRLISRNNPLICRTQRISHSPVTNQRHRNKSEKTNRGRRRGEKGERNITFDVYKQQTAIKPTIKAIRIYIKAGPFH